MRITATVTAVLLTISLTGMLSAQTFIPLINPSFEEPGVGKIKGWDGECADPNWTGALDDIPGWTSDTVPWDSGVETGYTPTDGEYTAFLMGADSSVYQITDYVIQPNDDIRLAFDSRITWAATLLEALFIYVDDAGNKVPIAGDIFEITGEMMPYEIAFKAAEHPEAVGHLLGIWFDNVSENGQSWLGLDNLVLMNFAPSAVADAVKPAEFALAQNYPNPFNPQTEICYALAREGWVRLSVFDATGRVVSVLVDGRQTAGEHRMTFAAKNLHSGIYFLRLETTEGSLTRKMILAK
ncbi:MAG: T9SS type A sorting domain-containing protein [candidate division KSB1 bacterium]|nr:T9SS type A sorting domain-containing protein [candidate division KSB1 bacterium]